MRVLHVIPGIAARYGGPSTVLPPMVQALNRLPGVTAEIATTDADGASASISQKLVDQLNIPVHLFHRTFSERWKFSAGLWRWLNRHVSDYDLLHVHALWTFSTTAACAAARRHSVPVVLRPCGMLSHYTWKRSAWLKRFYWRALDRRQIATVRRFHVTSSAEGAEVECLSLPNKVPAVIIPHGLAPEAWESLACPETLRRRCGPKANDRPIVLFLSRLHPKKGLADLLLPAFARLRSNAFLAIVGGLDENAPGYEAQIRATAAELGLTNRIALLGSVAAHERWSLFDGAAVFVLPSHSENFGMVVTEAMARGAAVVVSREVQASEHVVLANAGSVVSLDVAALAAALDLWLSQPDARQAAGENGRRYAREHFQWDQIVKRIHALYEDCLT